MARQQPQSLPKQKRPNKIRQQYAEWVAATRFLSTLPMPGSASLFNADELGPRVVIGGLYFPLVGLLIGACAALFALVVGPYLPPLVLSALLVIALIVLTGGLHLDGLMDTCDGLFSGKDRERQLAIMRDSRVGSFGVLGGAAILLLKFALFASFSAHQIALALLMVPPIARWCMVLAMRCFPSARSGGLGAVARQAVSRWHLVGASVLVLIISLVVGHIVGVVLCLSASLATLAIGVWITRKLGGLTGDVYGAVAEIIEVFAFLVLLLLRFWF
jgi:adenosylcobinamide-GDP ribazoletransferase